MLTLWLELLPSAMKLELLLRRLSHLRCIVRCRSATSAAAYERNVAMLGLLNRLARDYPQLKIEDHHVALEE
jgi:hypothetical protein